MKFYSSHVFFISVLIFLSGILFGQEKLNPNGYNIFYNDNKTKVSEGILRNGQPDGYWKTYYNNGVLKSEGNRKNFELDSLWIFYDQDGFILLEINYKMGNKHGKKTKYKNSIILIEEFYKENLKQDTAKYYYDNGQLEKLIFYDEGKKQGKSLIFSKEGIVHIVRDYESDFIVNEEFINRYNKRGLKDGVWKSFYSNGRVQLEGRYINNKREGFFREYSKIGELLNTFKYKNGELVEDVEEFRDITVNKTYFQSAKVKSEMTLVNGIPNGISRNFDEKGEIISSKIYKNGKVYGEGIVDKKGKKQDGWIEFYINLFMDNEKNTPIKKAAGSYSNGLKNGMWKYYYENGKLEQRGEYVNGKTQGEWEWYYENGNILRKEKFVKGLEHGNIIEYNDSGKVIMKGIYFEGLKEGKWFYYGGDTREEGEYKENKKHGNWKFYYETGSICFEGEFIDGMENGEHLYYYANGKLRQENNYIMGVRDGQWKKYNKMGEVALIITYENGIELKINGTKIKAGGKE